MKQLIKKNNDEFTTAHVTLENDIIENMYTQDAKIFGPGADPIVGMDAIKELTSQYMHYQITDFREETTDFYGNEDMLIDEGTYVMVYGPDQVTEKGKYLNVWKPENGIWKLASNMWNTNAPELND